METTTKKFSRKGGVVSRRNKALNRLEMQLARCEKWDFETKQHVPLTDQDKNRINGEMETLKKRI
jgi:hypothetical protein